MIDFKTLKSLIINGQSVKTLSIDGMVVWSSTPVGKWKGLKFKAKEAGSTVYMYKGGSSAPEVSLMYSMDDGDTWNDFTVCSASDSLDGTIITLNNVGDSVCFKGDNTGTASGNSIDNCNVFGMSGVVSAGGNTMSILNGDDFENEKTVSGYMSRLFQDCTSLTTAPELPATTLSSYCYYYMFFGCSSLITAPELPANALSDHCYMYMFYNCQSLVKAPELPATTLSSYCYYWMFYGCSSLVKAPELPATTLANNCYDHIFDRCKNLNEIRIGYTGAFSATYFQSWVLNVSSIGKFYYKGDDIRYGTNAIPNGWTVISGYQGLTFKATNEGSFIGVIPQGNAPSVSLMYSMNDGETWNDYTIGTQIRLNANDKITWKAKTPNSGMATSGNDYNQFYLGGGNFEASGNINSLLNEDFESVSTLSSWCYSNLFNGCSNLTNIDKLVLPTTLAPYCYYGMFSGCTSLTSMTLPATTLAQGCYMNMLEGCTSLTYMNLPATELENECYVGLFNGCSNLNNIILGYEGDFTTTYFDNWVNGVADEGTLTYFGDDETRGVSAIPENWEVKGKGEFSGLKFTARTAGSTIKYQKQGSPPSTSIDYSLDDGSTWTTYTYGTTLTLPNAGDSVCFKATTTNGAFGTTSYTSYHKCVMTGEFEASGSILSLLDSENYLTKTDVPNNAFGYMFLDCKSLKTPPELPATELGSYCYMGMFQRSGIVDAPYLPATSLKSNCYQSIFNGTTSLATIKIGYVGNFSTSYFNGWVNGTSSSGTFYYNGSDTTVGTSAIPSGWTVQTF